MYKYIILRFFISD